LYNGSSLQIDYLLEPASARLEVKLPGRLDSGLLKLARAADID
jgi:hypothetical protein